MRTGIAGFTNEPFSNFKGYMCSAAVQAHGAVQEADQFELVTIRVEAEIAA
jgi:hypothetical protein